MATDVPRSAESSPTTDAVFSHVVVGIDATPESIVAAAQAGALRAPGGRLELIGVAERYLAAHAGMAAADAVDRLAASTSEDLERAKEVVDADDAALVSGHFADALCGECSRRGATLIAVGVRPHRRLTAMTFGGHDVDALHNSPCSVLIARPGWGPHRPERIVVAVDGSPESRTAEGVARSLGRRLGCDVVPVLGLAEHIDLAVLHAEREDALLDPGPLADAVANAATRGSLVVVGRDRRKKGRWGGGAVERMVYRVGCSVLVVEHDSVGST